MSKKWLSIIKCILFIIYVSSTFIVAQNDMFQQRAISRDSILNVANIIIDSASCRVLVTVDENGIPHARAMAPFPPEADMKIWLGTSPVSRKVKHIRNNSNVVVYYFDSKSRSYVSVNGTARMVDDPEKKEKYWTAGWKIFYPDRDKDYILIEVTPGRLEVCSFKYKLFWDEESKPVFLDFTIE
jgi:general stress protein 26